MSIQWRNSNETHDSAESGVNHTTWLGCQIWPWSDRAFYYRFELHNQGPARAAENLLLGTLCHKYISIKYVFFQDSHDLGTPLLNNVGNVEGILCFLPRSTDNVKNLIFIKLKNYRTWIEDSMLEFERKTNSCRPYKRIKSDGTMEGVSYVALLNDPWYFSILIQRLICSNRNWALGGYQLSRPTYIIFVLFKNFYSWMIFPSRYTLGF